jgi:hypothetical protein
VILRSTVRTAAVIVLAALLSADAAFAAREKKLFLVLRLEAEGIDSDTLAKLDAVARKQTAESTKPSKLLPPPALDFESMRLAAGCSDDNVKCLAAIGDTLSATHVLRIRGQRVGDVGAKFSITSVRVKDAKVADRTLEVPALDNIAIEELRYAVAALFGDRRPSPPKRPDAPGGIALIPANSEVSLDDVEIFLDDKKFPLTALRNLPLGQHQLEVHKPGHEPFLWSGAVRAGQQTKVNVELRPIAGQVDATPEVAAKKETQGAVKETPPKKADPETYAVVDPKPKESAFDTASVTTEVGPEEPELFYTYVLGGSAVALTAVGVGGWAYLNSIEGRLLDSCGGEEQVEILMSGEKRCKRAGFTGCDEGAGGRCTRGEVASAMTFVGFIGGAVLGAATVAAFFVEDGPDYLSPDPDDRGELGAAIFPTDGGFAATFSGRY